MKEIVHGLWMQSQLTFLELLTINSFLKKGAEFHLWHYEDITTPLPKGCILRNGEELIPKNEIFLYPKKMYLGFGGESYVGFSEIFRYKVLYEYGGWWSDMDVTCLKPLEEIEDDYFFRFHGVLSIVGNIMKVPPKSELMKVCLERSRKVVNSECQDWHLAIRILCYEVERLGLDKYIHYNCCNLDRLDMIWGLVHEEHEKYRKIDPNWRFIHWCNSVLNKNYVDNSTMALLLEEFNCKPPKFMI